MKTVKEVPTIKVRQRLEELGGRTAQDLGLGRIVGQLLVYLYFQPDIRSLDQIEEDLRLSKAAASVAARQLDSLGLVKRVWVAGDKRSYYKSADNIATAIGQGLLANMRRRLDYIEGEFQQAQVDLQDAENTQGDGDSRFLADRIARALVLQRRLARLLNSPLIRLVADKSK
jgi:DNA-binding transcriptional regulator GbsR (MarR family)